MSYLQKKSFITWINAKASVLALDNIPNLADFVYDAIDKRTRFSFNERTNFAEIGIEVVGTQYEGRSGRIENVSVGESVNLVREPQNEYCLFFTESVFFKSLDIKLKSNYSNPTSCTKTEHAL